MPFLSRPENDSLPAVRASFDPQTGLILVHLDKVTHAYLNQPVRYQGKTLRPQAELRITILSGLDAAFLVNHLKSHPEDKDNIQELLSATRWTYRKTGAYFFVQSQPGDEAIIERVDVLALAQFLQDLSQMAGRGFVLPSTYVTLYASGPEAGVVPSALDLKVQKRIRPDEFLPPDDNRSAAI